MKKNALLVYPEFETSFWSFKFALQYLGKKSSMPPLGLLTLANMFSPDYSLRVVDMNVQPLTNADLHWADLVCTSTMIVQRRSLETVIARAKRAGKPVVAGGPHPTSYWEDIADVDYFLLGEVEATFPIFLHDLANGTARPLYVPQEKPAITQTPPPRYDLIPMGDYESMLLQFSRGCPFDCEFCDITKLYGRVPRTKTSAQMLAEFELLYGLGWRGSVFLVDDNFIGNRREALRFLHALTAWQQARHYPFVLRPGGLYQGTMLSKRHKAYGQGREVAPNTFVLDESGATSDKAHPHFYCNAAELVDLFRGFNLVSLIEREQAGPGTQHWHMVAERVR